MIKAVKLLKDLMRDDESANSETPNEASDVEDDAISDEDEDDDDVDVDELSGSDSSPENDANSLDEDEYYDDDSSSSSPPLLYRSKCLAHTLQLVIKQVYKHYDSIIIKARRLVSRIRKSGPAMEKLKHLSGFVVITDNTTRWNSTYYMIKRLLDAREHLREVLELIKADNLLIAEWEKLQEISNLLSPFADETDALQSDAKSLPLIIPAILDLQCHLESFQHCKTLTKSLICDLRGRFSPFIDPQSSEFWAAPAAGCLLHPSLAKVLLTSDMTQLFVSAKNFITNQVVAFHYLNTLFMHILHILKNTFSTISKFK